VARLAALVAALGIAFAAVPARSAAPERASISALDVIELQIGYTTILARYYKPVAPRTLVDGARTGIASVLRDHGIDATLPYTPAHVELYDGEDLIDTMVFKNLARYGSRVGAHALIGGALSGELAALHDPYSVLFYPQQFKKFNAFLGNDKIGGIGAVVSFDDKGEAHVDRVLGGGAAARAGILDGDAIVAIDGKSVHDIGGAGLRDALRGKIGTAVRVQIERAGVRTDYTLVRAEVHDPEVTVARYGDVGYLGLSRFGDRAGEELKAALGDLQAKGARAFVLDLRGNGGGYGDEATAVASAFIPSGTIFTTRERNGVTAVSRASGTANFHAPLVVLVDGDTASAAEIVAGAIKDDGVGTLVGTRTFGKGVVQSVYPLPDGSAFKVTTARYTTPKGHDIDGIGIAPDVTISEPAGATRGDPATDPQLSLAVKTALDLALVPATRAPEPAER
jgi:carboxyl-terminal processing protease